jgi:hypothetical protein
MAEELFRVVLYTSSVDDAEVSRRVSSQDDE